MKKEKMYYILPNPVGDNKDVYFKIAVITPTLPKFTLSFNNQYPFIPPIVNFPILEEYMEEMIMIIVKINSHYEDLLKRQWCPGITTYKFIISIIAEQEHKFERPVEFVFRDIPLTDFFPE